MAAGFAELEGRLASVPALLAALRNVDRLNGSLITPTDPVEDFADWQSLVTLYQIGQGEVNAPAGAPINSALPTLSVDDEARLAAQVTLDVAERLRRLGEAYPAWEHFDAAAYFDLTTTQAAALVQISERVSTVHALFHADWLLPSFQQAQHFWRAHFWPQYRAAQHFLHGNGPATPDLDLDLSGQFDANAFDRDRFRAVRAAMAEQVQRLCAVARVARQRLADEVAYLATNGDEIERARVAPIWQASAAAGLHAPSAGEADALLPALREIPTLTLSFSFPLPAHKQPGRLRRLRRNRDRARFRRERSE